MVLAKRVGTILKEAREAKKMSVRDIARETNMIPRYIEALENEDYQQFPGETYALGFLRSYSDYLHLDTEHLLNLYRGLQIDQSQTPLVELTRPTRTLAMIDKRILISVALAALVGGVAFLFVSGTLSLPNLNLGGSTANASDNPADKAFCEGRTIKDVFATRKGTPPKVETVTAGEALKFRAGEIYLKLCLLKVRAEGGQAPVGIFGLRINGESNYKFEARANESALLDAGIKELARLKNKILVTPTVLGDVSSAKLQIEYEGDAAAPVAGDIIQVTLQFLDKSFVEWEDDGRVHRETIAAGETRILEAKSRLRIKLGNGGGVKIGRGGQLKIAGPLHKIVKCLYVRVPDQYDTNKFTLQESCSVAK